VSAASADQHGYIHILHYRDYSFGRSSRAVTERAMATAEAKPFPGAKPFGTTCHHTVPVRLLAQVSGVEVVTITVQADDAEVEVTVVGEDLPSDGDAQHLG
jgi:hypothetical protein